MPASLKVTYNSDIRRAVLQKDDLNECSYAEMCGMIQRLFPEVYGYTAKYADDEGDLCMLCEASYSDFLKVSTAKADGPQVKLLRLQLFSSDLSQPSAPSGACASYKQTSPHETIQACVDSGCSDVAKTDLYEAVQQRALASVGQRLGGAQATAKHGDELRTKALLAAEQRQAVLSGITKEKTAELLANQVRQELIGRITELYYRLGEDMPMGVNAASLEKLQKHADRLRARLSASVSQPPGRNAQEELLGRFHAHLTSLAA